MAIKGTTFSSWVYFWNSFQTPGKLTENAIISNFQNLFPIKFESFSIFLIKFSHAGHMNWRMQ